jgi:tetratricopeptide (TPR) repeat protein
MFTRILIPAIVLAVVAVLAPSLGWSLTKAQGMELLKEAMLFQQNAASRKDLKRALAKYEQALRIFESVGCDKCVALTMTSIAETYDSCGEYQQSLQHFERSLVIWMKLGDQMGQALTLLGLGRVHMDLGNSEKALKLFERSVGMFKMAENVPGQGEALHGLANACYRDGQYERSIRLYEQSLAIFRTLEDHVGVARTLNNVAGPYQAVGLNDKALEVLDKSLSIVRKLGNEAGEAQTLNDLGAVYYSLGNYKKAEVLFNKALEKRRKLGDLSGEVQSLKNKATLYCSVGKYQEALKLNEKSLTIARTLGDKYSERNAINGMAVVCASIGDYQKALKYHRQALDVSRLAGDETQIGISLSNMSSVFVRLGSYDEATKLIDQSLQIFEKLGYMDGKAMALNNMGVICTEFGDFQKALDFFSKALAVRTSIGDLVGVAETLINISSAYIAIGRHEKALMVCEQALAAETKAGVLVGQASAITNMARVYHTIGNYEKALNLYEKALGIMKRVGNLPKQANIITNLGNLHKDLNQYEKALGLYEDALARREELGEPSETEENNIGRLRLTMGSIDQAEPILKKVGWSFSLGRLALAQHDFKAALTYYERTLESGKRTGSADHLFVGHAGMGLAYEGLKDYEGADAQYRRAVDFCEDMRDSLSPDQRKQFLNASVLDIPRITPYEGLSRVLLKLNKPYKSLRQAEATKARAFSEALSQRAGEVSFDIPEDLVAKDVDVNKRLAAMMKGLQKAREKGNKEAIANFEKHVKELRDERDRHVSELRKTYPLFAATKYPQPMGLEESALRDNEWVLEYEVTDRGICIYLVRGKKVVKALFKPIERKELDNLVRKFRDPFEGTITEHNYKTKLKAFDFSAGKRLKDILLGDILPELPKDAPVIIVPDDSLGVVPFEMLVLSEGGKVVAGRGLPRVSRAAFFGDRNPISYYQSITALTLARTLGRDVASGDKLLVMADPVFEISDKRVQTGNVKSPNLPHVVQELNKNATKQMVTMIAVEDAQSGKKFHRLKQTGHLAKGMKFLYGKGSDIFTGLDATKETLLKDIAPKLEKYKEIVFATHGYFGGDLPGIMEPVLMLTAVPPGTDGYLRLSEVMGLKMNADMVALTACMSGLGRRISGEGVMGMGRAFQYAGAKSVLMSLWSVEEKASVTLVESFFKHMKDGKSKLEALKLARTKIRNAGYDHPYFWAPFILVGEVGPPPTVTRKSGNRAVAARSKVPSEAASKPTLMGPSPTTRDPSKDNELLEAAKAGDLSRVKKLLTTGADIRCTDPEFGATPLHWAAYKGHRRIVSLLLKRGADVNAKNNDGRTPLMFAAGFGHRQVAKLLVQYKADPTVKDKDGNTALDWAKTKNHGSIVRLLKK